MLSSEHFPAYILCGGRSKRFGTDKAREPIRGQPQLLVLSGLLQGMGHRVHYVADRADRYQDLGVSCLVDEQANSGPLAGLSCALKHRANDLQVVATVDSGDHASGWLLLVSCDQAYWEAQWFAQLANAAGTMHSAMAAAYYDTAWQPLPALFHVDLVGVAERRLQDGQLSLQSLLSDLDAFGRCAKVVAPNAPSSWSFNTREELIKLSKR